MGVTDRLEAILKSPPKEFSPAPIWWWSGDPLEIERLRWQMDRFAEGGVYNLVLLNLAPTGPLYGSDPDEPRFFSNAWWDILDQVCAYAQQKGISIWFYDQIGFSGANLQGDIVREHPDFAGRWLESVHIVGEGTLELSCPSGGEPLAAGAVPVDGEGRPIGPVIPVEVVAGRASFEAKGRHRLRLAYSVERGFDYFNPEACRRLLDVVHGAYEKKVGKYFGKVIAGSFQDELPSMPTWGRHFAERFEARWGYRIEPHLIGLWESDDEDLRRVRVHYHRLRAEMAEEALFKPLFAWHEKHGLVCGFDQQSPSRAGEPKGTVQQYADYMATHRWYQAPGSDHHGDAKVHSSLAHLYGRKRVWIEAFHSSGWGGTLEETFDWLLPWLRAGATLYNPHAAYYSTRGGWWEWAPPSTCWRQPYWRHYPAFARAVTRLCAILSEGVHVCDIGILYPTTTVQAGMTPKGSFAIADRAHEAYRELVGVMHWVSPEPGVMDRDARDYDVLDEDSLKRGRLEDGALVIGDERFRVIVTPACAVLDGDSAEVLLRFAQAGGRWIAVGTLPQQIVSGDQRLLDAIRQAHQAGAITLVDHPSDLPGALADHPRVVDAPVPTLLRRVGGRHVLFVPAAYPCATVQHQRNWQAAHYDFDPGAYARSMKVTVRGVKGRPELWDVTTGRITPLEAEDVDGGTRVLVPFDSGPMALVVWPGEGSDKEPQARLAGGGLRGEAILVHSFAEVWNARIEPTIDNRFGDFAKPDQSGPFPPETWSFEHRLGLAEEPGSPKPGGSGGDAVWGKVHATFGVWGKWLGPAPPAELPPPQTSAESIRSAEQPWRDAVYSLSRGILRDPLHYHTLGPKAHVPEEFCRFGAVKKGEAVQYATRVWIKPEDAGRVHLALAAQAAKEVWVNGERVAHGDAGYLSLIPVDLKEGENVLVWRLVAEENVSDLRSYWALVKQPSRFRRPEWITTGDQPLRDSVLRFSVQIHLDAEPVGTTIQLGADAPARLLINGVEAGRQGGFDPYNVTERVQPYTTDRLRAGVNEIAVEVQDVGRQTSILVDARIMLPDGTSVSIVSGPDWKVARDGKEPVPVGLRRRQWIDPAWSHLWRRPHPLPGAMWIEEREPDGSVLPVIPDAWSVEGRPEWFRWILPPGVTKAILPVLGDIRLWVDDEEVGVRRSEGGGELAGGESGQEPPYMAELPHPERLHRVAVMRVIPRRGCTGGGVFYGPVRYPEWAEGSLKLGEWLDQGLAAYSGAIRYRTSFDVSSLPASGRLILDLGRVRGTAEVSVNGASAGVRVWSPYRFDITEAVRPGRNDVEILVCNTLGPYLRAVSPTPYVLPGQERSGVYGPVRLLATGSAGR